MTGVFGCIQGIWIVLLILWELHVYPPSRIEALYITYSYFLYINSNLSH